MSPLDDLARAYQGFRAKGADILAMRHDVTLLIQEARQRRPDLLPELQQRAADLNQLYYDWVDADGRVQSIVDELRSLHIPLPSGIGDLGVVPLIVPAVIVAAIAAVLVTITWVVGRYATQKQLFEAVKNKLISPSDAARLGLQSSGGPFGELKTILTLGAVVAALAFVGPVVRDLTRRST